MRKLDRYIIKEMLGPFLFGMGAFAIVLIGVDLLYSALEMILEQGLPPGPVLVATAYRLPQTLVLTLPMATIFASLMAFGGLSSHGEVTAMRAGGVGLYRMAGPALLLGLTVSVGSFGLNGWIIPFANQASNEVLAGLKQQDLTKQGPLVFRIPSKGPLQRMVGADGFDATTQTLRGVVIWEWRNGVHVGSYTATSAQWQGTVWVLKGAKWVQETPSGAITSEVGDTRLDIGKSPWELAQSKRKLQDLSLADLRVLGDPATAGDPQVARNAREEVALRFAVPWAALGLALIGLPLGIRPQRTSTGVGLGLSLAIILLYYIVISMMRILGQQEALPPHVADWIPNVLLYTIALGLLLNSSR